MSAAIDLADLARLLRTLPEGEREPAAAMLGFRRAPVAEAPVGVRGMEGEGVGGETRELPASEPTPARTPMTFWRVEAVTELDPPASAETVVRAEGLTREDIESPGRSLFATPPSPPLTPWATLWPALFEALQSLLPGRDPDLDALLRAWARGEGVGRVPRAPRRVWPTRVSLWVDRSARLVPLWSDQSEVRRRLEALCGRAGVAFRCLDGAAQELVAERDGDFVGAMRCDPMVPVLVLGDLGFYGTARDRLRWLRTARRLRAEGVRVAAVVPCPASRWEDDVARAWNAVPWERSRPCAEEGTPESRVEALLRLVAPTALASPGLVRALRGVLPASQADASTEVDLWQHRDLQAADATGLVLAPGASARWRARFATDAAVSDATRAAVSELVARWHGALPRELLHAETLAWLAWGAAHAPGDEREALAFAARLEATLCGTGGDPDDVDEAAAYGKVLLGALPDAVYTRYPGLKKVWSVAFRDDPSARLPTTIAPHEVFTPGPRPEATWWAVRQRGAALVVTEEKGGTWPVGGGELGSPIAHLRAMRRVVYVREGEAGASRAYRLESGVELPLRRGETVVLATDRGEVVLRPWGRERWAVAGGRDRYGLWAAFEVKGVRQRMRWVPPGTFVMGSPETEGGRIYDEVQHPVTLTEGYWLGETPVTQALWEAVMDANPSRFQSPDRPVERVSWDDCQRFIARVNKSLDGLVTRLPREAEWERACRAGTTTATWAGDLTIKGYNNASELDAIAWYGGNSGVDYDLDEAEDTSAWQQKRHPHTRAGTHPVGRRHANPYGLHDMLGNVYEWCMDRHAPYMTVHAKGTAPVIRGGSWSSVAQDVRAAGRSVDAPAARGGYLGFRLAGGLTRAEQDAR